MSHHEKVGDEEFEYEYDPVETETFHVDLDLSTVNVERRESLKRRKLGLLSAKGGEQTPSSDQTPAGNARAESDAAVEAEDVQVGLDSTRKPSATGSAASDLQILDLHGQNPLVSYQNQIYHCTWSDLVGTAMFFSKAEAGPEDEALMSTDNFRLVNTSRIKLIGQKAKLATKPGRKRPRQAEEEIRHDSSAEEADGDTSLMDGKSLGKIRTGNPKVNAAIKRQAAFLEKLMDVKRAKGESDNVRTVFSQKKGSSKIIQTREMEAGRSRQRQDFPSVAQEIKELNRRVVRGDATALVRLQDIYSSMEDEALNRSSSQETPVAPSQQPDDAQAAANAFDQRQATNE